MRNHLLRTERLRRAWTQRQLADFAGISLSTVERSERGEPIRVDCIQRLCECLSKTSEELGLLNLSVKLLEGDKHMQQPASFSFEEWDGCFSFGRLKTTTMVLDGDGTEAYLPVNIRTHYDPQPAVFFDEIMQAKKQIELEERQKNGELWNSEKYHLSRIVVSREAIHENMTLSLWFKPRDHYTGLATRKCLDNPQFRAKYLDDHDWYTPVVGMSMSMGIDMAIISSDGYIILTQRGQNQSVHQGMFNCSVSEAVSPLLDRSTTNQAPDLYRCAARGFAEELGLQEAIDFSLSDVLFLSFTVDTHYALYGLRGLVKVNKSSSEILQRWQAGVKDKRENSKIFAIPFTPQDVCSFVFSHEPFTPGGLVCVYHIMVHEFGREEVNKVIASYGE
jgi:DNA-binding Xre family transcriptional regulator